MIFIAFVKERFHNAVEIDILGIFGRSFIATNLAPPKNSSGANSSGANYVIAIDHVLCLSHVFLHVSERLVCWSSQFTFYSRLVYLLVEFWTMLPCCVDCCQASCVVYV